MGLIGLNRTLMVVNGIKRFDSIKHGYGKRASSGMIIGYIVSMSIETILKEVNDYQQRYCIANPPIKFSNYTDVIHQYQQQITRKHLKPKPFRLVHLWVDLRNDFDGEASFKS